MVNSIKTPKSPKVLMISPYFVPRKRVGALRSFKFAKYLKELDWQVCVVHLEAKGQTLSDAEKVALEGVALFTLKTPFDRTINRSGSDLGVAEQHCANQIGVEKLVESQAKSVLDTSKDNLLKESGSKDLSEAETRNSVKSQAKKDGVNDGAPIQRVIDEFERYLPMDTWYPLLRSHLNYMEQIIIQEKPDLLWVTADPWSGLSVVRTLSKRLGIPYIVDFRDPFTLCPIRSTKKSSWVQKVEKRLETKVIQESAAIVFTANETLKLYQKTYATYAEKMHLIHNAFDNDLFKGADEPEQNTDPQPDRVPNRHEKALGDTKEPSAGIDSSTSGHQRPSLERNSSNELFKILFLGKFRSSSPVEPLIESFKVLYKNYPDFFSSLRIYHIGTLEVRIQNELDKLGFTKHFSSLSPVPYDKVPDFIEEFDGLISLLNPNRNMVIPSKFWDYLPATPPIISIGTNPEMDEILTNTQRGYQFDSVQTQEIANKLYELGLRRAPYAITGETPKGHYERIAGFSAKQKTKELSRLFMSVITN